MLIYHQAHDINHCVYRLLLILESTEQEMYSVDVYRIVDFYTLFPYLLNKIKPLPRAFMKFRSIFSDIEEPFEALKNTKRILHELEGLQSNSIQNLLAKEFLDRKAFESGYLKRTQKSLPKIFIDELETSRLLNKEWFKVLINEFPKAKFAGRRGLKYRTGLMEFRYDMENK